ncbi:response regulator [Pseudomonas sp. CF161]|uniref:response regulator n=1 Tax=Pseudomonas sp. CF161 TaxID=911241 RepID=UPI000355273B|nr:response regulator [Pseudomonas sp. CF161]EPL15924.1 LuxR family DNA-binding response regulator [Pseudomonas sp. CF161]
MKKIKIVLADDHPVVLMGVREYIERDNRYEVVAQVQNSTELVENLQRLKPDVVITDYNMPGDEAYGDGIKLIEYLIRHFPNIQVLILTMVSNNLILSRLYDVGVAGIVPKSSDLKEILVALNTLAKGQSYRRQLFHSLPSVVESVEPVEDRISSLSVREFEVLRQFAAGMSVNEIAHLLNRSKKTISAQKISAMRKLQVTTDHELLSFCITMRLIV